MAHPTGMQQAFQIKGLQLLTPSKRLIVSPCVFGISPNHGDRAEKNKAAATAIANGFGIHQHHRYSVSDSSVQEVAA
ncbi:hypothetical protein GGR23_000423 [Gellertiella hungarica]|uniref:Uncharacterized protein n=2 Tax=Gellertiella hungarica TaxID=1572859 RepID=A0A7W6NJG1_9HYPH|nr:hypothetical protein [Gellertiella hungarica]